MTDTLGTIEALTRITALGFGALCVFVIWQSLRGGGAERLAMAAFLKSFVEQTNRLIDMNVKSDERNEKMDAQHKEDNRITHEVLQQYVAPLQAIAESVKFIHEETKQYKTAAEGVKELAMTAKEQLDLLKEMDKKLDEIKAMVDKKPDLKPVLDVIEDLRKLIEDGKMQAVPVIEDKGINPQ